MRKRLLDRREFVAASAAAFFTTPSLAQTTTWPSKQVKILAGFAAGGQTDQFARFYGEYISREIGQPVVVENKTGAGGAVAAMELKRSEPDGHTLMVTNTTTFMLNPVLMKDIRYDVARDFVIVSVMPTGSLPLLVSEKIGAKTLAEFVDSARKCRSGEYACERH